MDEAERLKLKSLANDAIIASFGYDNDLSRLAQGLERCVDNLSYIAWECDHCKYCDVHGEVEDDEIPVDANEVIRIHGELKKQVQALRDFHVRLCRGIAEDWTGANPNQLTDPLAEIIEETEG